MRASRGVVGAGRGGPRPLVGGRPPVLPGRAVAALLTGLLLAGSGAAPAAAQEAPDSQVPFVELDSLRHAALLEAAGDLQGAADVLERVLSIRPASMSALLGFERLAVQLGRPEAVLPAADRMLELDPGSPLAFQTRVRVLAGLDRMDEVRATAEAWIEQASRLETPYREIAAILRERGAYTEALEILHQGRQRVGGSALALELGDVYAAAGDFNRAALEWDRAVGPDGSGFLLVQKRLRERPAHAVAVIRPLLGLLAAEPSSAPRRRAALHLALDAGLHERAQALARAAFERLPPEEHDAFLLETARRADGGGLYGVAYWAYGHLLEEGGDAQRMLALRTRHAELALELGDTAAAALNYGALEDQLAPGSPERRQARAVRIQLLARDGRPAEAAEALADFRSDHPDAAELDAVAAAVAEAWLDAGDAAAAEAAVRRVDGARSGLVRGRLLLRRGDTERARAELVASAPSLRGAEATRTIALAMLLSRLSPAGGEVVAEASARAQAGEPETALARIGSAARNLPSREAAAVLAFGAELADEAGLPLEAEALRRRVITEHPRAHETPAALVALARALANRPGGTTEARALLEQLILEHPRSALVPQARRDLDRLKDPAAAGRRGGAGQQEGSTP